MRATPLLIITCPLALRNSTPRQKWLRDRYIRCDPFLYARTQHVMLRGPLVLAFVSWFTRSLELPEKIVPYPSCGFLKIWREVFLVLHTDVSTPGSLRAGAATELYKQCGDLNRIRGGLRHTSQGSLESYIQELPHALLDARRSPATRAAVELFGSSPGVMIQVKREKDFLGLMMQVYMSE